MNEAAANANKRNWAQEMESASSLGKTKPAVLSPKDEKAYLIKYNCLKLIKT